MHCFPKLILIIELIFDHFNLYECNVCNLKFPSTNCTSASSKYRKLEFFNHFNFNNSFLISSFDSNNKLKCLSACSLNDRCSHSIFKQNKCYLCNENVVYYLSYKSDEISLIYQKNRFNQNFKYTTGLINYWPFYTNVNDSIGNAH
jgi:hypothetical protein